ncbi:hypothetical protein AAKU55_000129 [Oxalobacteraceae bacterium GrIS 1.11]
MDVRLKLTRFFGVYCGAILRNGSLLAEWPNARLVKDYLAFGGRLNKKPISTTLKRILSCFYRKENFFLFGTTLSIKESISSIENALLS